MLETGRITARKLFVIVFLFTIGSSIIIIPSTLATQAKQDAWIVAIVGLMLGTVTAILFIHLAQLFPKFTLVEICEQLLGKMLGNLLALLFVIYFMLLAGLVLRDIGNFITTEIMFGTPIEVIHILFILVTLFAVRLGLEVFSRTAEIFLPLVIFLFVILVLFLIPDMNFSNLQPVFESGYKPLIGNAVPMLTIPFLELIVFLMILPHVNNKNNNAGRSFLGGIILGGSLLIILTTLCIVVFGAEITARNLYPTYLLGKKISIGAFVQRIEVIVGIMWFLTIFFKLTICIYAASLGVAQIFQLSEYRVITTPICIIVIVLSFITSPNTSYSQQLVITTWPAFSLVICLFLPLLLYVIAIIRRNNSEL